MTSQFFIGKYFGFHKYKTTAHKSLRLPYTDITVKRLAKLLVDLNIYEIKNRKISTEIFVHLEKTTISFTIWYFDTEIHFDYYYSHNTW